MGSPPPRSVSPGLVAFVLSAFVAAVAVWAGRAYPDLAGRLTEEDELVEWIQVTLLLVCAGAAALAAWRLRRAGRPASLEVVITVLLAGLIVGELDLDKRLFGVKIIATRFFLTPRHGLALRVAAAVVVVGVPVALAVYVLRRRRELWQSARAALDEPWARPVLAGAALLVATELFEKQIGYLAGWPRHYLEEVLEFISGLHLAVGLVARHGRIAAIVKTR